MKFQVKLLPLLLLFASPLFGQTAQVTGNLKDVTSGNVTTSVQVDFELQNYGSQIPHVISSGTIAQVKKSFKPDTAGFISGTVFQNSAITPLGTFYKVCIIIQGNVLRCNNYLINADFDLNSAVPLSVVPVVGPSQLIVQCTPFVFTVPSATWILPHNFGDINVWGNAFDASGNEMYPDRVVKTDANTLTMTWVTAKTGQGLACHAGSINIATNQPNAIVSNPLGSQIIDGSPPLTINVPTTLNNLVSATSSGANPATAGLLRLSNADQVRWRDSSNAFDWGLRVVGASGNYPESLVWQNFPANTGIGAIVAGAFIQDGATANVATTGAFRMHSVDQACWRNNLNSADVCLSKNSSDQFSLGGPGGLFIGGSSSATAIKITPTTITGVADLAFTVQSTLVSGVNGPSINIQASGSNGSFGSSGGGVALLGGASAGDPGFGGNISLLAGNGFGGSGQGGSILLTPGSGGGGAPRGTVTITAGYFYPAGVTFLGLGTPIDGALVYCTNCVIANPCAGSGTGAMAKRLNGVWVCN